MLRKGHKITTVGETGMEAWVGAGETDIAIR